MFSLVVFAAEVVPHARLLVVDDDGADLPPMERTLSVVLSGGTGLWQAA